MKQLLLALTSVAALVAGLETLRRKMGERDERPLTDLEEAGTGMHLALNAESYGDLPLATSMIQ